MLTVHHASEIEAARIEPLQPPYDDETAAALELLGPPIQLFRVFARHPELARGIAGWGHYCLSRRSALSLRHRELVIDRATARCGADYEWGVHIAVFAGKAGLSDDQVRSLATGSHADPCWLDPGNRAVLRSVDELHGSHDLSDDAWSDLVDAIGEDGALEVTLAVPQRCGCRLERSTAHTVNFDRASDDLDHALLE